MGGISLRQLQRKYFSSFRPKRCVQSAKRMKAATSRTGRARQGHAPRIPARAWGAFGSILLLMRCGYFTLRRRRVTERVLSGGAAEALCAPFRVATELYFWA